MRTLILSISAGGGHMNAAEAVQCYINNSSYNNTVKLVDTIKYINPFLEKVVIGSYLKSLKLSPGLFGKLYDLAEKEDGIASFSNKINEFIIYKLIPLIQDFNPDIIVTTHPFPTEMMSIIKKKRIFEIPVAAILTDYAPHCFWIHPNIDAYIVSNDEMVEEMKKRGVHKDLVYPLGIPVKPEFLKTHSRKSTLTALNLKEDTFTILIMGGSMGMGKISVIYNELQKVEKEIQIIVITGNNKKLMSQLYDISNSAKKTTRLIGYSSEISQFMQACDLLITKPGGLTVTEALISKIPLALFTAIPGQEKKNAEFLFRNNLAVDLGDINGCSKTINELLRAPKYLTSLKANYTKYAKPTSGKDIYCLLNELVNNYESFYI